MGGAKTVIRLVDTQPEEQVQSAPPPQEPRISDDQKKTILMGFLSVVAVMILAASYRWFIYADTHISTNNAYVESEVWPINSHNLGYVKQILVKENERVKKGQLMVQLDDADVKIEIRYKRAKYEKTLADVERARKLNRSRLVSSSDLETAEATLTAMQADLDGALLKQEFTRILAPTDGVVGKISIHPNQFVQPGQSLMLVVEDSQFWIKANYKETDLRKVKRGMPVAVEIDAFPGETWDGEVDSIYPSSGANMSLIPPENATGNFTKVVQRIPVKIKLKLKPEFELRSGMSAISTIIAR